jgi:hypothetical protein
LCFSERLTCARPGTHFLPTVHAQDERRMRSNRRRRVLVDAIRLQVVSDAFRHVLDTLSSVNARVLILLFFTYAGHWWASIFLQAGLSLCSLLHSMLFLRSLTLLSFARAEQAAAAAARSAAARSEPEGGGTKWKMLKRRKDTQVSSSCSQEVQKFSAHGSSEIHFLTAEAGAEEGGDSGDTMVCRMWECRDDRWLPFVEAAERTAKTRT